MRWAELILWLAPVALFLVWQRAALRGEPGPSRQALAGWSVLLVLFGGGLAWFGVHDRLPGGSRYIPAHLERGVIVPGHGQ